jgi:predicted permease
LFASILYLYPPAFRRAHGRTMRQFARTAGERQSIGVPSMAFDMVRGAVREWLELLPSRRRPGLPPQRQGEPMRDLVRDLAHAARLLRASPGFTAAAILTLALGIGANSAIFTLARATVLRPLQVQHPEQLVTVPWSSSYPDYTDYATRSDIFTGVAAVGGGSRASVTTADLTELADMVFVSGNAFAVLGVRAAIGRTLLPADDVPNGPAVAVLGYDYWTSRFARDPAVVGRAIRVNGQPVAVVGVAEEGFRGTSLLSHPALFAPLSAVPSLQTGFLSRAPLRTARGFVWLTTIARLRDDVPRARAESEMDVLYRRQHPAEPGEPVERLTLGSLAERALGGKAALTRRFVAVLFGVSGLTLLIGCASLANLLLARAAARRSEIGIRLALGATRGRVLRLLLVESTVLAGAGGCGAIAVAAVSLRVLSSFQLPGGLDLSRVPLVIDGASLAVTAALSVLTGLLFGAAPAWRASRADVLSSLSSQSRSMTGRGTLRSLLLGAQVAISLVLLTGTGLLTRSLASALHIPLGFEVGHVATASVNLGLARYDAARAESFYAASLDSIRRIPQVESAAWSTVVPTLGLRMLEASVADYNPAAGEELTVLVSHVTPNYFRAAGMPTIEGRDFSGDDTDGAPLVAVVNETMAKKYWKGRSAIGGRIKLFRSGEVTVVGVTGDTIARELGEKPAPYVYLAFAQWLHGRETIALDPAHLFVRLRSGGGRDETSAGLSLVRERLTALDPQLPLYDVLPFEERVRALVMPQRLGVTLFLFSSALALTLAVVGIYGVARYIATTRTREIGLRMALGATQRTVTMMVLAQGSRPVIAGIGAGLLLAFLSAGLLKSFLHGITPADPVTFAGVTLVMTIVTGVAIYLPARRAARVEPVIALRAD